MRREDSRVAVVERGLLAAQLGTTVQDLDLLGDDVVRSLLDRPSGVLQTIGAARLLEKLDAHAAREHPVDVDYLEVVHPIDHAAVAIARVPLEDDVTFDVTLRRDGTIDLDRDLDPLLSSDEAEHLAYALLRLVQVHRSDQRLKETDSE